MVCGDFMDNVEDEAGRPVCDSEHQQSVNNLPLGERYNPGPLKFLGLEASEETATEKQVTLINLSVASQILMSFHSRCSCMAPVGNRPDIPGITSNLGQHGQSRSC